MDELIKLVDDFPEVIDMLYGDVDLYDNEDYFKDYKLELVQQNGGKEQGSNIYAVYKVNDNAYIKVYGFYQSFVGAEYEGCKEVTPKVKEIICYE